MRAVVYEGYGAPPELVERPEPDCPEDGVLVRVAATGVCRSDWHAWRGHDPVPLPMTPGHELVGVVAGAGAAVTRWRVGDRVTTPFVCGCGRRATCATCAAGDTHVCPDQTQPGFTGPGSFADVVALHAADTNLVAVPSRIGDVAAASLGCRFATAYRALVTHARVTAGDWVAVHGCGGVGLSAVMVAVARGARVVAVDRSPAALARAAELGAEVCLDPGVNDVASAVRAATSGGTAVSLDAVGTSDTAAASVRSLRRRGRHVQVGLLLGEHAAPALPMDRVVAQELELYGSHGMPARDYPAMLALVASGDLQPERLVGRTIGLDEAPDALAAMDDPASGAGMTVVDLSR